MNKYKRRKSYFTIMTIAIFLLSIITMGFSTVLGKDVVINKNGEVKKVFTYTNTVGALLDQEGIVLGEKEEVTPDLNEELSDGMEISIQKIQSYEIRLGNKTMNVEAKGASVEEVLNNLGIKIGKLDIIKPSLNTATDTAAKSFKISIDRVKEEIKTEQVEIDFEIITKENDSLDADEKNIITQGKKGLREDTIKTTYINNQITSEEVISSKQVQDPINQVEEIGKKNGVVAEKTNKRINGSKVKALYTMEATAYDPSAGSVTAIGTNVRVGIVAVDPSIIPLGSKLYIESVDSYPNYGYAIAEDTGGDIKGNRIDLFYNDNSTANDFGRRTVKVYVLDK